MLRRSAFGVGVLVLLLVGTVKGQQWVLRWWAERLLADFRSIQMGKSTWADAQRLMNRWGAWGMWDGTCTAESCEYQIVLQDVSHANPTHFWSGERYIKRSEGHAYRKWMLRLYSLLGGRVAQLYAGFHVANGKIWTKSFAVLTAREDDLSDDLVGEYDATSRFTPDIDWGNLRSHSEYTIRAAGPCEGCHDGACSSCELIATRFTPFADSGVVAQLTAFDLSCITKWLRCTEPREIMPAAWRMYQRDQSWENSGTWEWPSCRVPIDVVVRDYRFALLTRVEAVKAVAEEDGHVRYEARLEPLRDLKGDALKSRDALGPQLARVRLGWNDTVLPGGIRAADVKAGEQMMFLFEALPAADRVGVGETSCSYVPDTVENRAAVMRGIERDVLGDGH